MRCHLPYPDEKYFQKHDKRCNACQNKLMKERMKREIAKKQVKQHKKRSPVVLDPGLDEPAELEVDQLQPTPSKFLRKSRKKKTIGYMPIYMLE